MRTLHLPFFPTLLLAFLLVGCEKKDEPSVKPATQGAASTASASPTKGDESASPKEVASATAEVNKGGEAKEVAAKKEPATKEETSSSPAVATVNGEKIPDSAFQAELDKITGRGEELPEERLNRMKQSILRRLVDEVLLRQTVKAEAIKVPAEKLTAAVVEYKGRFESEERFNNYMRHSKIDLDDIKQRLLARLEIETLLLRRGEFKVSENEARAFYQKNKRFYMNKAGVKASHILVKLGKRASKDEEKAALDKIRLIQKELKSGKPFAEIAKKMSEDLSAPRGGELGFFGKGHMVPAFEKVAFSLPIGEVSPPVRTHFGYHLITIHERRDERSRGFEEVQTQIQKSLINKLYFMKRRQLLSELKNSAAVESLLPGVSY
jgi:peptidyl-prolyl cis-trans isomerase C